MSATISLTSAQRYGVERVCAIWEQPRSSFYARRRNNAPAIAEPARPDHKRGPKTQWTDTELLGKIQADLERSPFQGEGHRKVWARLRVMDDIRVSRKRVLRIMRENRLLSPYRCRKATGEKHTGTIGDSDEAEQQSAGKSNSDSGVKPNSHRSGATLVF